MRRQPHYLLREGHSMASPALFKVVLNSKPGAFQFDLELTPRKPMDKVERPRREQSDLRWALTCEEYGQFGRPDASTPPSRLCYCRSQQIIQPSAASGKLGTEPEPISIPRKTREMIRLSPVSAGLRLTSTSFCPAVFSGQWPVAVAARSPSSFRSSRPLAESRKCCRTSGPDAAPSTAPHDSCPAPQE